jgi:hypothetical protein
MDGGGRAMQEQFAEMARVNPFRVALQCAAKLFLNNRSI